jgi:hypothetical protein
MDNSKGTSIKDCEEALEQTLTRLRNLNLPELRSLPALDVIAPKGFRPIVSLLENGRKKRRTASAETWSPATGEISISFERAEASESRKSSPLSDVSPADSPALKEMLSALQEAESAPGRSFVALKWFRDEYLHSTGLSWAQDEQQRHSLLTQAINDGWILTSRIPNPKAPLYPTTTIRLNRQKAAGGAPPTSRFRPVPIAGEPLSTTILRDRGTR